MLIIGMLLIHYFPFLKLSVAGRFGKLYLTLSPTTKVHNRKEHPLC